MSPDLRGRGRSQYDVNWRNYHPGIYLADISLLLADAGTACVVIIGTSLGGILGMLFAAARPESLAGLVLNDIGPEVAPEGIARISGYVGRGVAVENWDAAAAQARATNANAFPEATDADWLAFARRTCVEADGAIRPDMDPMIGEAVRAAPAGAAPDLWPLYAASPACQCSRSAASSPMSCRSRPLIGCRRRSPTCGASACRGAVTRRCSTSPDASR